MRSSIRCSPCSCAAFSRASSVSSFDDTSKRRASLSKMRLPSSSERVFLAEDVVPDLLQRL